MKRSLLTVALLFGVAPTATAAPFGEVPFRSAGGTATCLRATGYPGELVRSTRTGPQFLQAGAGGLVPVADVKSSIDPFAPCPEAAARQNGAGVVAFSAASLDGSGSVVRAALREPGGPWGAPVEVTPATQFADGHPLAADVSERGDALVAFAGGEPKHWAIRAVRRAPGGAFTAPETVFSAGKGASSSMRVAAGLSAAGEAIVAWSFQPADGKPRQVWAAVAAAGAAFGTPAKLGTLRSGSPFSLAVGADGTALVAFPGQHDDVLVAERAPGAGFGPASRVGTARDPLAIYATVAIRPDGGAVVAWQSVLGGKLQGVLRTQRGSFSAPVTLAPDSGLHIPKRILALYDALVGLGGEEVTSDGPDEDGENPRATIAPDGRVLVTSSAIAQRGDVYLGGPRVTTISLAGGAPESHVLGAQLRQPSVITPVLTAEGTPAIAWTDNNERTRDGRLHLALEGVADGVDPAAPRVRLIGPTHRVLKPNEDLRFTVRCSAACDVNLLLGGGLLAAGADVSLTHAGEQKIKLSGVSAPLATLKGGPVKLLVRYGAPGARRAAEKTLTLQLRRLPDAPRPRVLGAVARRVGKAIVVTWHTDRDAKPSNFFAFTAKTRNGSLDPFDEYFLSGGGGLGDVNSSGVTGSGRNFSVRLDESVAGAHYVKLISHVEDARKTDTTTVRVRG
jgi:hypothetical protein